MSAPAAAVQVQPGAHEATIAARPRRLDTTYVGVLLFISSEAMFFAGLFAVFYNARGMHPQWPPADVHLEMVLPIILTVILVTSSFTMQHAVRRIAAGDHTGMIRGLAVTLVLGLAFLGGQLYDYSTVGFTYASGSYGAAFFTLTGFHGAHVLAGVLVMLAMIVRATQGQFSAAHHAAIEGVAAYWHFVDVIWLLVFSTIYLVR
jgi:cytochrome c oxidase subunit 3